MALIPSDAGLRLRQPGENALLPLARLQEIPADLPGLRQGQSFTASIQEVLPDNTYRALVAGSSVTLSLPEAAKAGDTLELVVLDRTPRTIVAQLAQQDGSAATETGQGVTLSRAAQLIGTLLTAELPDLRLGQKFTARITEVLQNNTYKMQVDGRSVTLSLPEPVAVGDTLDLVVIDRSPATTLVRVAEQPAAAGAAAAAAEPYPYSKLSSVGQMIGALVTPEGESPPAAPLNRGEPLLAQAPQSGAELAPVLAKAVVQSGLFYEAHQAQWVAGKLPLAALLEEPQGQQSLPATLAQHAQSAAGRPQEMPAPGLEPGRSPAATTAASATATATATATAAAAATAPATDAARPAAEAMPEALRPLVQQQLDAAATQRLLWHGEVWPGQTMEWRVEHDQSGGGGSAADGEARWKTTLSLSTPRLGEVRAAIQLSGGGVRIALATSVDASANDLRGATPALGQALASAGVPLLGISVKHDEE